MTTFTNDALKIEILEDGTIKVTTDAVSGANHANAEQFLAYMAKMTGGETTRTRRGDVHGHHHHTHGEKDHDHESH